VSAQGKSVLITGCDSPLAWFLALKLDELGFTVFAAFKDLNDNDDASLLQDESSARMKLLQLDVTSEIQVMLKNIYMSPALQNA
jgi:3-hydroxybutyrate dehydrogenase